MIRYTYYIIMYRLNQITKNGNLGEDVKNGVHGGSPHPPVKFMIEFQSLLTSATKTSLSLSLQFSFVSFSNHFYFVRYISLCVTYFSCFESYRPTTFWTSCSQCLTLSLLFFLSLPSSISERLCKSDYAYI